MPTGVRRFGARGRSEWAASIFATVDLATHSIAGDVMAAGGVVSVRAEIAGISVLIVMSLLASGRAMFLVFLRSIKSAVATIRTAPWVALRLGLAVFAATPVVIGVLFMTVVGWLPAVVIGALYLIVLLAGPLISAFFVGDVVFRLTQQDAVSKAQRLMSFVVALVVILILGLVPLPGALLIFAPLLGLGALSFAIHRAYIR